MTVLLVAVLFLVVARVAFAFGREAERQERLMAEVFRDEWGAAS